MGTETGIAWTDHTFNPVRGCRYALLDGAPSPACAAGAGCYAESWAKRNPATLGTWGADGARVMASETYWREPVKWNAAAERAGKRARVFCASLADIFEGQDRNGEESELMPRFDYVPMLNRLFALIEQTPWLDWQLLTKRPRIAAGWADAYGSWPDNAWIGATVENQRAADERIPWLLQVPARVRFLSMEPLFGRVDLDKLWCPRCETDEHVRFNPTSQPWCIECDSEVGGAGWLDGCADERQRGVSWVIVGGSSGFGSGALDLDAVADIVRQCREAGVACFVKQMGSVWARANRSRTAKGEDPGEWLEALRVREWPEVPRV